MTKNEVDKMLGNISGTHLLIAKLFYGCGLRLMGVRLNEYRV